MSEDIPITEAPVSLPERIVLKSEDDSVELRQITLEDAPRYFELVDNNREHLSRHGDTTASKYKTLEDVKKSITEPENTQKIRFGIWDNDVMVGTDNLTPRDSDRAELGSWVASQYSGHHYAARARKLLTDFAFHRLGIQEVYCLIAVGNEASRRSVEHSGFIFEGEQWNTVDLEVSRWWKYVLRSPAAKV